MQMLLIEGVFDRSLVMGSSSSASFWAFLSWTGWVAAGRSTVFFHLFLVFVLMVHTVI